MCLNIKNTGVGKGSTNGKWGRVLADIKDIRKANPRLTDIAMLGAHDCTTAGISPYSPFDGKDKGSVLEKLRPLSRGFQYRYMLTQSVGVGQLLLQGARFLHIKYTFHENDWYTCHSAIARELSCELLEILSFLEKQPGELVVLLFQPSYFGNQSYESFHDSLARVKYKGKSIYDYVHYTNADCFNSGDKSKTGISQLRYNALTQNGGSAGLVLFDRREDSIKAAESSHVSEYSGLFYDMDSNALHAWHSRLGKKALIKAIESNCEALEKSGDKNLLRVNQAQAAFSVKTPGDVLRSLSSWSLLRFAEKYNASLLEHPHFDLWLSILPVFQVDFTNCGYNNFNDRVNEKIRAFNEKAVQNALEKNALSEK